MGMRVMDKIPVPAQTVSGKTTGPAVALGRCRVGRGMPLFLHVTELRDCVKAFGWPTPESHGKVTDALKAAEAKVAALEAQVAEQAAELAKAEQALTLKFGKTPAKPKVEPKQAVA